MREIRRDHRVVSDGSDGGFCVGFWCGHREAGVSELREFGGDQVGVLGLKIDPLPLVLSPQTLGEADHVRFGSGILRQQRAGGHSRNRRNVHHSARFLCQHGWEAVVGQSCGRVDVQLDQGFNPLAVHFVKKSRVVVANPDVVHQNADIFSRQQLLDFFSCRFVKVREVHCQYRRLRFQFFRRFLQLLLCAREQNYLHAQLRQLHCHRLADAVRGARDHGPLAVRFSEVLSRPEEADVRPVADRPEGLGEEQTAHRVRGQTPRVRKRHSFLLLVTDLYYAL
mmetsp:Transcript_3139/g.7321  ORF Transcript_3139/g.7321 Transcript_3139/m.7321 type:complete len:281 (+) Transcript_3139:635-1477(+)